jgi:hypothetical protein
MFDSFKVVGLLASLVLVSGCAAEVDGPQTEDEGDTVATAEQSLDADVTRLRVGKCKGDGMLIKAGIVDRLGVAIGEDVTGITEPNRSVKGPVCHNKTQWDLAATYICNKNGGGMRSDPVLKYGEYVDNILIWHPGGPSSDGLYKAYLDVRGPCDSRSKLDYELDGVECCMNPATPMP